MTHRTRCRPARFVLAPSLVALALVVVSACSATAAPPQRNYPYFEIEGTALSYRYIRQWRAYYWREDITLVVRDDDGNQWRIISREPTPWTGLRLGTTHTGIEVDWKQQPRVQIIGVRAIDRIPEEFYDVKLDPEKTATAFIVRVKTAGKPGWQDVFVNNWFHRWGDETDVKMLAHYANDDPNYTVYGYLAGIAAPFDAAGQKLLDRYQSEYNGIIHHSRVVKAENDLGYELRLLHLMGRHKETARYEVFYGDPKKLTPLDQRKPE